MDHLLPRHLHPARPAGAATAVRLPLHRPLPLWLLRQERDGPHRILLHPALGRHRPRARAPPRWSTPAPASPGTIFLCLLVKRDIPWIEFGLTRQPRRGAPSRTPGHRLHGLSHRQRAQPARAPSWRVNYALGPLSVVIFSTARTVSRGALQMVQMVNSTFEAELTISYGAGKLDITRTLHRRACQLALIMALASSPPS